MQIHNKLALLPYFGVKLSCASLMFAKRKKSKVVTLRWTKRLVVGDLPLHTLASPFAWASQFYLQCHQTNRVDIIPNLLNLDIIPFGCRFRRLWGRQFRYSKTEYLMAAGSQLAGDRRQEEAPRAADTWLHTALLQWPRLQESCSESIIVTQPPKSQSVWW